jgi:hypothetical protein
LTTQQVLKLFYGRVGISQPGEQGVVRDRFARLTRWCCLAHLSAGLAAAFCRRSFNLVPSIQATGSAR